MLTFDFNDKEPPCKRCRHVVSQTIFMKKTGDIHRVVCAFKEEQIGHARVPSWCPKYKYLHDGVKDEK